MDSKAARFLKSLEGKKVALCGIGKSNLPLISLFSRYGAQVTACDKRTQEQLGEAAQQAKDAGAQLSVGEDYLKNLEADILFRTPGMRFYMEELNKFREQGVAVTSEMEVFFELCPCKIIAVTGSDGKTTTTSIIAELLKAAGKDVHLGGNIGKPLLPEIETINETDVAVVELSSFQLISMRQSPDIAVVTNLAPNHLDIHKDMQEYIDAKKNIILHQNAFSRAVINMDNEITKGFAPDCRGTVYGFSRKQTLSNGCYTEKDGSIMMAVNGNAKKVMDISDIKIPGMHNVENYLAAIAAVWGAADADIIRRVAKSFNGVEHRAEFVRVVKGVKYYNDSIASSPTRTACGTLSLYDEKIILIAGGYDKKIPYEPLGPVINKKVKLLILMGATAGKIEAAVKNAENYEQEHPDIIRVNNMEQAVQAAYKNASDGDIVSLSPASASFDLYPNFDARGKHFKELVDKL